MAVQISTLMAYAIGLASFYLFVFVPMSQKSPNNTNADRSAAGSEGIFNATGTLVAPEDIDTGECPEHKYTVHIFSRDPLVVYIPDFVSAEEIAHVLDISTPLFAPSRTNSDGSTEYVDPKIRNSSVALLPRTSTIQCIEARALAFQGWRPDLYIERLRSQLYKGPGGHYVHHYDWSASFGGVGRVSTFNVYLEDGCEGGGTEFPLLNKPLGMSREWCQWVECEEVDEGVTGVSKEVEKTGGTGAVFKPKTGSAVYWENFKPDGKGDERTWHAGLPVKKGVKIGLNVWSWYQPR
ncbi:MAG: hypothetical protein M1819_003621 [Sarea resinae]|nr:MAG: hypothetical protein M1819_003621 [Sarea resinae]